MPSKKPMRLVRIPDAFLPAALAGASMIHPNSLSALQLAFASLIVAALSLFAGRGVRIAFARQPSIRHVRGSVKSALALTLLGDVLCCAAVYLFFRQRMASILPLIAAGGLLNIEHVFYEYMYAIGDKRSAALSRGLTALFMLAGLLLAGGDLSRPLWPVVMAGLSALAALVVSLVMGDGARGKPNAAVLRVAPIAALQTALYPAAALALHFALHTDRVGMPFFAGLTLYELCKTPFRRSPSESRPFNRALLIVCGAAALLWALLTQTGLLPMLEKKCPPALMALVGQLPSACVLLAVAALCALALFGNVGRRDG